MNNNYRRFSYLLVIILSSFIYSSAHAQSWNTTNTQANFHSSEDVARDSGVVSRQNSQDRTRRTTTITSSSGQVTTEFGLFRNVQFLQPGNSSISAGGFTFAFNPFRPQNCGSLSYTTTISGVNFTKSLACDARGNVTASTNFSVSRSVSTTIPTGFGPSVTLGLTVSAGVGISLRAGPQGEFDAIPHPIVVGGFRRPDYVRLSLIPQAGISGSASLNLIDLVVFKVQVGGNVNFITVRPTFYIEVGYRKINESGSQYQTYLTQSGEVDIFGGNGVIYARKILSLPFGINITLINFDLVKWDPIYRYRVSLYRVKRLTSVLGVDDSETNPTEPPPVTGGSATVKTSRSVYSENEGINVSYTNGSTSNGAWIGLFQKNAADTSYGQWKYTKGQTSGNMSFNGLSAGEYEVRIFRDSGYIRIGQSSFTVTSGTSGTSSSVLVRTKKDNYSTSEKVEVEYKNGSSHQSAWIGLFKKGDLDTNYGNVNQWRYTYGLTEGMLMFTSLPVGDYEVRIFQDGGYNRLSQHAFTVR